MRDFTAARLRGVEPSATVSIADKAKQLVAQGRDVIDLSGGDPHFKTPRHIVEAAHHAMLEGDTHYAPSRGVPQLIRAVQQKFSRDNGLEYAADEIVITPGGKLGLYATIMATVDPGDEVLLLSPAWVSYEPEVRLAGGTAVYVPLEPEDYRITPAVLRSVRAPRAKVLVFNTPNNPTGRVATEEEIRAVAEFAQERDLLVISDELYEKLLYDGRRHLSIASLPGMRERTVTINGASKSYAMTGWRLGYLGAPRELASQILKIQQHSVTSAATFTQFATAEAIESSEEDVRAMLREYERNRSLVVESLSSMDGVRCPCPEGAFYAFPSIGERDSVEFARKLLDESGVAVTPGVAFGPTGEHHVRISFAVATRTLERAMERMRDALAG